MRTRICLPLAVAFVLGVSLTLVQVATGSDTLALLLPWRLSSVLRPVATAAILARLVSLPFPGSTATRAVAGVVLASLALAGVWIMVDRQAFRGNDEEIGVLEHVRRTAKSGDVYLLPVRIPTLAKDTRGSLSSDFKPPAAKRADVRIIPIDLQSFRLRSGAPIHVDFKAIPYRDTDVIEWRHRLDEAVAWRESLRSGQAGDAIAEMRRPRAVTCTSSSRPTDELDDPRSFGWSISDPAYLVYRIENVQFAGATCSSSSPRRPCSATALRSPAGGEGRSPRRTIDRPESLGGLRADRVEVPRSPRR